MRLYWKGTGDSRNCRGDIAVAPGKLHLVASALAGGEAQVQIARDSAYLLLVSFGFAMPMDVVHAITPTFLHTCKHACGTSTVPASLLVAVFMASSTRAYRTTSHGSRGGFAQAVGCSVGRILQVARLVEDGPVLIAFQKFMKDAAEATISSELMCQELPYEACQEYKKGLFTRADKSIHSMLQSVELATTRAPRKQAAKRRTIPPILLGPVRTYSQPCVVLCYQPTIFFVFVVFVYTQDVYASILLYI